ncbi:hypothetical protein IQ03_04521 [Gemmobacter caeni]|uniref:Uncharacterized protein n=1 Tax=Gemmobacter caeni TaxID=589035 RepID=A0A2T6AP73_9RHOB|nr:hypothetical protein C8N34_12143 [Gemmobacter caeni]TWI93760.1 hypothetical protein IQ03_04521 [Gemmobacter caeni]
MAEASGNILSIIDVITFKTDQQREPLIAITHAIFDAAGTTSG